MLWFEEFLTAGSFVASIPSFVITLFLIAAAFIWNNYLSLTVVIVIGIGFFVILSVALLGYYCDNVPIYVTKYKIMFVLLNILMLPLFYTVNLLIICCYLPFSLVHYLLEDYCYRKGRFCSSARSCSCEIVSLLTLSLFGITCTLFVLACLFLTSNYIPSDESVKYSITTIVVFLILLALLFASCFWFGKKYNSFHFDDKHTEWYKAFALYVLCFPVTLPLTIVSVVAFGKAVVVDLLCGFLVKLMGFCKSNAVVPDTETNNNTRNNDSWKCCCCNIQSVHINTVAIEMDNSVSNPTRHETVNTANSTAASSAPSVSNISLQPVNPQNHGI